MTAFQIVTGTAIDVAAIMPIMDSAFDPVFGEAWTAAQCLSTLAMPNSRLLLAQDSERTCGFALSRWVLDEEELLLIGVSKFSRRQGVGRAIVDCLISNAKHCTRKSIFLEVRSGNPAQQFYAMMGFRPIGQRPNYYRGTDGSRHDSITMALKL
jgi:[ribosomal protein S18]-alanine N-acetyltransferase